MGCNCNDICCPRNGQLCVDASFFVPEFTDCAVGGLYFCPDMLELSPLYYVDPSYYLNLYYLSNNSYCVDVYWNDGTKIAKINTNWSVNPQDTDDYCFDNATVTGCNLIGADVMTGYYFNNDDMFPCPPECLLFNNNLTLDESPCPLDPDNKVLLLLKLAGKTIFEITLDRCSTDLLVQVTTNCPDVPGCTNPFYTRKVSDKYYVSELIAKGEKGLYTAGPNGLHASRIGESCLCLQLRANRNLLSQEECDPEDPGCSYFYKGDYEVCVVFKDCEGNFKSLSVVRLNVGDTLSAYWGKDTNRYDTALTEHTDSGIVLNKAAKVSSCGHVSGVYNNTNDLVICIENVMQAFPGLGSVVDGVVECVNVPSDCLTLPTRKTIKSELANSKLYVAIKSVSICPGILPPTNDPVPACRGTLNPFVPRDPCPVPPKCVKVNGFTNCEVVSMNDHPLHGSDLSRDVTCCLTNEDIEYIRDQLVQNGSN
jgi:hypothetical protein